LGQLCKNGSKPIREDCPHVFQDDVAGSNDANGSHEFVEQAGTGAPLNTQAFAGLRDVLTGEASNDNIS